MTKDVNLPEMMRQIGLEELATIEQEEIAKDFMPAAVAGFADGDMLVMHEPYTGRRAEFYGEDYYDHGKVAKTLGRAALANGMARGNLYDFQGFTAQYFTEPGNPFEAHKTKSSVRIYPEAVTIDRDVLALGRVPSLVIDYGACLTGRGYIADQMAFLDKNERPFAYTPLTRLHFTNQALVNTYDADYGRGIAKAAISNRLYIGREDGVAKGTNEIINAQTAHNAPTEVADIILCTGAQHTTTEDLKQGITNAHKLLREDGMLIVRSLARPAIGELGTEEIAGWALDAGFTDRNAVRFEAPLEQVGTLLSTGHFGEREIQTLILTK